jgi:hypothetical protein
MEIADFGRRARVRARYWAVDVASVVPVAREDQVEDAKRMIAIKKSRLTLNPANARYRFA